MASSVGPRAKGSDGSDYSHREQVANHYRISAEFKPKLKKVLLVQILCALTCLAVGLLVKYDFICLVGFSGYACGLPMGFLALRYNSPTYINLYGCCCSLLGVFPMVYLLYISLWTGAVDHYRYLRLAAAVVVMTANAVGMLYAKNLMNAWTVHTQRRR